MKRVIVSVFSGIIIIVALLYTFPSLAFYQEPQSKKGLLVSGQNMFDDVLELGVDQVIYNLATWQDVDTFLPLAKKCKESEITLTMILINGEGAKDVNLLPVGALRKDVATYAFNTMTEQGENAVRYYARNVVRCYGRYVSNWVIGNEVNDALTWDYNGISDMDRHADSYAKTFRIFYDEIKRNNPEARVFIPFDMRWKAQDKPERYTVSEYLPKLNERLKDTEYGIAWHPLPVHYFDKPEFLDDDGITFDINTTPNINLKNLSLLTDYMQRREMRDPKGAVRHLILSEQGFTSACENGEERQSEAIKAAYEIAKNNPYVEAFYLMRQVDAAGQEAAGGAFGLWRRDHKALGDEIPLSKKKAWYTYQTLDE